MNLETRLRSWRPRRPVAAIKARLFPASPPRREPSWRLRWLAPTAACGLIALAALRPDNSWRGLNPGPAGSAGFRRNDISALNGVMINRSPDFFEWTNRSGSALSIRSFLPGTTN